MELTNIEKLLEKYFEATTTVAEETTLQEYFSQQDVAPHLQEYQPMFQYFSAAKKEQSTRPVPLKRATKSYYKWISVAAVAALMFGIYFGTKPITKSNGGEINDPEIAYQETKKALNLIAQNLNKGTESLAYLGEFEEAKNKILKND